MFYQDFGGNIYIADIDDIAVLGPDNAVVTSRRLLLRAKVDKVDVS